MTAGPILTLLIAMNLGALAPPEEVLAVRAHGNTGIDVLAGENVLAPLRLSTNGAIVADQVDAKASGVRLARLRCKDPQAVSFAPEDYVSIELVPGQEPLVRFQFSIQAFDAKRWQALFPDGPAPLHFLSCAMPTAQVWHQRGWLNATPNADPFPLLEDVHVGTPELSCKWNRNWSYLCPLGAHPIPMIGVWDPAAKLYVGYDFQAARSAEQSERYVATAYCWRQGDDCSFITLAYPAGGVRYGELVYPKPGERIASYFQLIVDRDLPATEDPNERFQRRLFARYKASLPRVPERSDVSWIPGSSRLGDFAGPASLGLFGPGGEGTFYPEGTVLIQGWGGHQEMPIEAALRRSDTAGIERARARIETLLDKYAKHTSVDGEQCLFWEKPLEGAWRPTWGGRGVTTLHNTDAWYPARVLVELYRYDLSRGKARPEYLKAIDEIYNWTRHFVWTRNEFADVPSSPFAIGSTLSTAFLLDYYFTFRDDAARRQRAEEALTLANRIAWRYLPMWAMDSDRFDAALDGSFLIEPNSGRDWAGLACANEVHWVVDILPAVYVHTGDDRLRWYLRGILDRWPLLYRPEYGASLAACGPDSMSEGLGLFDGAGPGRGGRYDYGSAGALTLIEPVGASKVRVVAGTQAAIAFCKDGAHSTIAEYRTDGRGACAFRVVSSLPGDFDLSFTYPYVDISRQPVKRVRDGQAQELSGDAVRRPPQSPASLYLAGIRAGDVLEIGSVPAAQPLAKAPTAAGDMPSSLGDFAIVPLRGDTLIRSDWNDLKSFAGLSPGLRWTCGVPFAAGDQAASQKVDVTTSPDARAVFVAYALPPDATAGKQPAVVLDNDQMVRVSGRPVLAWRAWPPMFDRLVLLDQVRVPAGRRVRQIDPAGGLVIGVTLFTGPAEGLTPIREALATGADQCDRLLKERDQMASLRLRFAAIPQGKIAILPGATSGAASALLAQTGLESKAVTLTGAQLVDEAFFNAKRFPVTLYLGGEDYPRSVRHPGDGKAAILHYLAGGGTLVLSGSGPFPCFYGDESHGGRKTADPLLPQAGLPIGITTENAPADLKFIPQRGQDALHGLPASFPFGGGDGRIRSVNRAQVNKAHHYVPLIAAQGENGRDYGDVACWLDFKSGPAAGGRVVYLSNVLQASPYGNQVLADTLAWALEKLKP